MRKILFVITLLAALNTSFAQKDFEVTPAVEILSEFPNVRDFTLSSTGNEAYVSIQSPLGETSVIVRLLKNDNKWSGYEIASFSGKFMDLEAFLSFDNLRLYFASNRPLIDSKTDTKDFDIWYVQRQKVDDSWGEPINLGAPINTVNDEFFPSLTKSNNLYYTGNDSISKGRDDIFFSALENGKYSTPISLSESINTEGYEFNAFIDPDEKFLIFTGYNREDGLGSGDMYISFKDGAGKWLPSKSLGDQINSQYMDYCPYVDWASMTLYFTSKRNSIDKNTHFKLAKDLLKVVSQYENGLSRIYKVDLKDILIKK